MSYLHWHLVPAGVSTWRESGAQPSGGDDDPLLQAQHGTDAGLPLDTDNYLAGVDPLTVSVRVAEVDMRDGLHAEEDPDKHVMSK